MEDLIWCGNSRIPFPFFCETFSVFLLLSLLLLPSLFVFPVCLSLSLPLYLSLGLLSLSPFVSPLCLPLPVLHLRDKLLLTSTALEPLALLSVCVSSIV